ncbi:2OG-Fe(II) oxygenase family protein [Stutzerimonas chloritidismutans]
MPTQSLAQKPFPETAELFLVDKKESTASPWTIWADEIIRNGYAIITINSSMQADFKEMQSLVGRISVGEKKRFSFVERTDGFYPVGYSYLKSVVNSDLCETFNYWSRFKDEHAKWEFSNSDFYALAASYESQAAYIGQNIFKSICEQFGYSDHIDISKDSYLQFNYYRDDLVAAGKKYLQKKHEDGHLLTIIKPNAPGLVVYINGKECLVDLSKDQAIVISGSLLTLLTEGAIEPTYHAVVNLTLPAPRCSVVFNVNVLNKSLPGLQTGQVIDLFESANAQHMQFGHNPLV